MHESGGFDSVRPGRTSVVSKVATGLGMAGLDEKVVTARALRSDRRRSEALKKACKQRAERNEITGAAGGTATRVLGCDAKTSQTEGARDGRFRLVL